MSINKERITKIEEIRHEIFEVSKKLLSLDIYLERAQGVPQEEYDNAEKEYKRLRLRKEDLQDILSAYVRKMREEDFDLFQDWVQIHINTCTEIINYAKNPDAGSFDKDSTRIYVAKETKQEWESVLKGEKFFVIPNVYYLTDYDKFFDKFTGQYFDNEKDIRPKKTK